MTAKRILLVEDEEEIADILALVLRARAILLIPRPQWPKLVSASGA
jgi:hypothetical protein